jgi:hypothetical protein
MGARQHGRRKQKCDEAETSHLRSQSQEYNVNRVRVSVVQSYGARRRTMQKYLNIAARSLAYIPRRNHFTASKTASNQAWLFVDSVFPIRVARWE